MSVGSDRVFLMLQGPHGPFYRHLGQALIEMGCRVHRVAFNASDEAEWRGAGPMHRYNAPDALFADWLEQRIDAHRVTDIVVYGDTRPVHAIALDVARRRGITTHCLEEGYVRPSWITYERSGNNGNSRLMDISLPAMAHALGDRAEPDRIVPAHWGDSRQHMWLSALYHLRCLLPTRRYGGLRRHRSLPLGTEVALYCRRIAMGPWIRLKRGLQHLWLLRSDRNFHLVLLQLSFDASMQVHSDYTSTLEFAEEVLTAFAESGTEIDTLVFKAHPFEDGRERLERRIRAKARQLGIADRVVFLDGGKKLASLLDRAQSAITVNSTAAQQALWRGKPVAALGRAIYRKPGLVSEQSLVDFLRHPRHPDLRTYWLFRAFMMEACQVAGSFYSRSGRRLLLETLPGRMLAEADTYDELAQRSAPVPVETPIRALTVIG